MYGLRKKRFTGSSTLEKIYKSLVFRLYLYVLAPNTTPAVRPESAYGIVSGNPKAPDNRRFLFIDCLLASQ